MRAARCNSAAYFVIYFTMKKKKVLASVATVTVFGVFTRVLSFIFKIYLSRTLGAEAIGLYQIAMSVFYLFSSLSASGIPLVLSRKTAEHDALQREPSFSLFTSALIMGVCISLSTIAVLLLFRNHLGFLFSEPLAYPLFLIMIPALLSTAVYSIVRGWFWGKKQFTAYSVTETLEEVFRILFSILFISGVIAGVSGAYAVALAFTVSDMLTAVLLFAIFLFKGGKLDKPSRVKDILTPSIPVTAMRLFSSFMGTLIAFILPLRLLKYGMTAADATASFGRISGMANPLLFAPNAIISSMAIVLIPEMSANGARKQYGALNKHLNNGINFAFLVSGLFMVLYIALGQEITELLYNDSISGQYLQFAAYLMLPMSLSQLTQSALNSIGKELRAFVNYIVGNLFMVVAILILPKYIGIYAVAVSNMLSLLVTSVMNVAALRKHVDFPLRFVKHLVMILLFLFPSAFLADCLHALFGNLKFLSLVISALAGMGMYAGLCFGTELVDVKGFLKLRRKTA